MTIYLNKSGTEHAFLQSRGQVLADKLTSNKALEASSRKELRKYRIFSSAVVAGIIGVACILLGEDWLRSAGLSEKADVYVVLCSMLAGVIGLYFSSQAASTLKLYKLLEPESEICSQFLHLAIQSLAVTAYVKAVTADGGQLRVIHVAKANALRKAELKEFARVMAAPDYARLSL